MILFDATTTFRQAAVEINILISYAKKNKSDSRKYATFNKAAVVLLCTKFETFLESFLEEYAFLHMQYSTNKSLKKEIYEHLIDNIIDEIEKLKTKKDKRKSQIKNLVLLCGENEIFPIDNTYSINSKLKFGKHGEGEVQRLLTTFGFNDFSTTPRSSSFFKRFNSLNGIRNNIVHEDATPSLTHQDVENYLGLVTNFISDLEKEAQSKASHLNTGSSL